MIQAALCEALCSRHTSSWLPVHLLQQLPAAVLIGRSAQASTSTHLHNRLPVVVALGAAVRLLTRKQHLRGQMVCIVQGMVEPSPAQAVMTMSCAGQAHRVGQQLASYFHAPSGRGVMPFQEHGGRKHDRPPRSTYLDAPLIHQLHTHHLSRGRSRCGMPIGLRNNLPRTGETGKQRQRQQQADAAHSGGRRPSNLVH